MLSDPIPTLTVRAWVFAAVVGLVLAVAGPLTAPGSAQEDEAVVPGRVGGESRFHTAAEIARLTFDEADTAHIVYGGDFPDALAASYAAGAAGGPILPVPSDEVGANSPTMQALEELGVQRTVLVGGEGVLSPAVAQELEDHGYETDRIAGENRYETAAAIALTYGRDGVGTLDGDRTAIIASGENFPDALAAGPVAAHAGFPLLLMQQRHSNAATNEALEDLGIERVIVVGGVRAISEAALQFFQIEGYEVERWAGETRTDTAGVIAEHARTRLGFEVALTLLARGDHFADALAASVHGGVHAAPILLTETPRLLSVHTTQWLRDRCPDVRVVRAIGGTGAVTNDTLADAVDSAEWCQREPHTEQSYIQAPQERQEGAPGDTFEITVLGFEEEANLAPVNIALFPCDVAAPTDPDDNTFRDQPGDGFADGIGTTGGDVARITSVHGEPASTTHLRHVQPDADNRIEYTIHSPGQDCAIHVVFHDGNNNEQLDVDEQGRPLEPWNYGEAAWTP